MLFKFKIKIQGLTDPQVWREVEVPSTMTFLQFHSIIQIIFGWENAHLWNFEPPRRSRRRAPDFRIEEPYEDSDQFDDTVTLIASDTALYTVFPSVKELVYTYDYGDYWVHSIKLEKVVDENRGYAICTGGNGTTPPEDCGGVWGYVDMKEAFEHHDEEKMRTYREWLSMADDEVWDADVFGAEELKDINAKLKRITVPVMAPKRAWVKVNKSEHTSDPDYCTIQELLKRKTVTELRRMAPIFGLKFKTGAKKDFMLDYIADWLIREPEKQMGRMFYYELKAFLDIINGDMSLEYARRSGLLSELNRFGLIYTVNHYDSGETTLHVQMDIADSLKPLIPAELERRERDGSLLFEKLALGCANIYGYTEMYYLQEYFDIVGERVGREYDNDTLTTMFQPILAAMESGSKNERHLLLSPFSASVQFFPDEEHIRFEIPAKKFDFDTIVNYGEMPYPQFPVKEAESIRKMMGKYGKEGWNADEVMRKLWLNHQDRDMKPLSDLDFLAVSDESVSQLCLDAIMDFQNNVPCWMLGGNSSQEGIISAMEGMKEGTSQISIGPNLRGMGIDSFEQVMEMARNGADFPELPLQTSAKVGRNDPCPCGSGKKYKHCCGRKR